MNLNHHIAGMPAGYLFAEIARRVKEYEANQPETRVIRMGIGDVTRPLSPSVAKAFADAALGMTTAEGFHGYGPDGGYPFLIERIIRHDYQPRGVDLHMDEVFISDGAKTDTGAIQELFSADARIAVTAPVYPVYVDSNAMAGRLGRFENGRWSKLVTLPCSFDNGFVPELPRERVDVLYLCYPNNPTGTVLNRAQLQVIVDWARAHDTLIIYDAAYKAFITDPEIPTTIYEIPGAREVAIECCSFSKTAGFTGVRCAWTVIPREVKGSLPGGGTAALNALWRRRCGSKSNGVSFPVQKAAASVYSDIGWQETARTIAYYQDNAQLLLAALGKTGLQLAGGVHAPYVWLKTPGGMSGWDFFDYLLKTASVVGTPGEGFGTFGQGCFRLTAFSTKDNTQEAAARILDAINKL
ncbi:MAG: LL-diaminopimelate aminotransferase [Clostridiales bacterium]|nr:LL-diaminopimelate aminotransferase [Clostridiales bacterium]